MPRKQLTVQNKTIESEKPSSSIVTRSSSKRANNMNGPISTKKVKVEDKPTEKENIPKGRTRRSTKSKEEAVQQQPPTPVHVAESDSDKDISVSDDSDEEYEEEQELLTLPKNDKGQPHPKNKSYLVYENAGPNQEALVISRTARYWSLKYCKTIRNVYPDTYDMYIHADFSCYGELEIVENCIRDLTKDIFIIRRSSANRPTNEIRPTETVNYISAFRRLEALTILLHNANDISGIDDGDRFYDIMRVIGACYVTILRGLLPKVMFGKIETFDKDLYRKLRKISKRLPNFKQALEQALIIGHEFLTIADVCSAYTSILQIVYCNWTLIMDKISIDLKKISDDKLGQALNHAATIDMNNLEHGDKESFDFLQELRSYKGQYGLGGDSHDISKWSRSERAQYSLQRFNPLEGLFFLLNHT